ncbi:MAG: hypothetical protein P1U75_14780 [Antarcticimicrobium sp.]|uniref:DUF6967 family protein n=1 Tax=Antarcticimicrobium sp. TaxID=2824147 RepID=UPI00260F62E4|nr:hypothetical protein [Antarcticimicrobium sp.]MDF1717917.1 hypothetical protein [Antarcticimicrobium sp.]
MNDKLTDLAEIDLPYRRKAILRRVEFDGGLTMVRLVLREGTRITQVDLDAETATALADAMTAAARDL